MNLGLFDLRSPGIFPPRLSKVAKCKFKMLPAFPLHMFRGPNKAYFYIPTLVATRDGSSRPKISDHGGPPRVVNARAKLCYRDFSPPFKGLGRGLLSSRSYSFWGPLRRGYPFACRCGRRGLTRRGGKAERAGRAGRAHVQERVCSCALGPALGPAGSGTRL